MLDPVSNRSANSGKANPGKTNPDQTHPDQTNAMNQPLNLQVNHHSVPAKNIKRRSLPQNSWLKRLDWLYWRRLLRYFYVRFLRMQATPQAIARGVAAGLFAGSFPLLGFQSIIGIAIALW
ncbi:MAG: DUF2062 domain-containing protein [Phormidesmis sp. RL_2_1]|nr:DUF2062 domain-containing protein [Phormidesmis sp. RL_2_1]